MKSRRLCSELHNVIFDVIIGFNPLISSKAHHHWSPLTRATTILISLFSRSLLKLVDCSPLVFFFSEKTSQNSSCRDHERSLSTSSVQERTFSPQSLFLRRDPHLVFKVWIINDACTSPSHSTIATTSVVASPLFAETLAMKNAMISAHSCELNPLNLEALVKKLLVFIYDSNRLTYPFIALVFFNVTSEFHSMALNSLFVIFS